MSVTRHSWNQTEHVNFSSTDNFNPKKSLRHVMAYWEKHRQLQYGKKAPIQYMNHHNNQVAKDSMLIITDMKISSGDSSKRSGWRYCSLKGWTIAYESWNVNSSKLYCPCLTNTFACMYAKVYAPDNGNPSKNWLFKVDWLWTHNFLEAI